MKVFCVQICDFAVILVSWAQVVALVLLNKSFDGAEGNSLGLYISGTEHVVLYFGFCALLKGTKASPTLSPAHFPRHLASLLLR